jgi:hypothetical protein
VGIFLFLVQFSPIWSKLVEGRDGKQESGVGSWELGDRRSKVEDGDCDIKDKRGG